ncbi:YceI family protein [Kosakonia sacchari]|uniref:YceI family protein n=1 Tax=Kosakonia sacchari TaxID=1158459 RepID=UPI003F55180E
MKRIIPAMMIGLLSAPGAQAMPLSYRIATPATTVALSWHAFGGVSQAHLDGVSGDVTLNPAQEREDRINVTIPVATLIASNSLLTYQLKSSLFFDADHYPTIAFSSSRVVDLGDGHFRVFGSLAVKNIRRPVILDATLQKQGRADSGQLSLHATTAISRSAFNMDKFAMLVDDTVTINIEIHAQAQAQAQAQVQAQARQPA